LCSWQKKERCTLVEHASAFTVGNDLPTNPQTLFRCQCARTSVSWLSRLSLNSRSVSIQCMSTPPYPPQKGLASISVPEGRGFTLELIKREDVGRQPKADDLPTSLPAMVRLFYSFNILACTSIDANFIARVHKQGDIDDSAGLKCSGLGHVVGCITTNAWLGTFYS
jgi:hypothetical protein